MLLHTQVTSVCHLDKKIHFDEKKFQIFIPLPNSLRNYFKALPEKLNFEAKNFFFIEF